MKLNQILLIGLLLISSVFAAPVSETLQVGSDQRKMLTYVPSGLEPGSPLIISIHGMDQDPNYQHTNTRWDQVADTARFAVVYPQSMQSGYSTWDINTKSTSNKDIQFFLAIIDDMEKRYQIDRNRVYLGGFSMGGMITYLAMGVIADKIAAFAPISGYLMQGDSYQSSRPIPIIHTHGTKDGVVGYDGVANIISGWRTRNGCPSQATTTQPKSGTTRDFWGPCDEGVDMVLVSIQGKDHEPSGTSVEIWNFVKNYSLGPVGFGFKTKSKISLNPGVTQVAKLETNGEGTVSFSISGGADKDMFVLSGSDLSFKEAPTYQASGSNQYAVSITAKAGDETATLDMTVTILKPQMPYKGTAWAIPGKIEAEDYDVGSDENPACSDLGGGTASEQTDYRTDKVDVIKSIGNGYAVGHTQTGEWTEYTVDVKAEGVYTLEANVVSGNDGSSIRLFIGDEPITENISVPNTDANYAAYGVVTAKTSALSIGTHVIRLEITGNWVDIDWLNFSNGTISIGNTLNYSSSEVKSYRLYNFQGAYMGTFNASNLTSLKNEIQKSNVKAGAYMVRSTDGHVNKLIQIKK